MLSHGVIFNLGSAKVCSPAIFETYFTHDKDIWIALKLLLYTFLLNCAISIDSYTSINKSYRFIDRDII